MSRRKYAGTKPGLAVCSLKGSRMSWLANDDADARYRVWPARQPVFVRRLRPPRRLRACPGASPSRLGRRPPTRRPITADKYISCRALLAACTSRLIPTPINITLHLLRAIIESNTIGFSSAFRSWGVEDRWCTGGAGAWGCDARWAPSLPPHPFGPRREPLSEASRLTRKTARAESLRDHLSV